MLGRPTIPWAPRLAEDASEQRAYGVVVRPKAVAARRATLEAAKQARRSLRLSLATDQAIFWATEPTDLPWFAEPLFYLGAPRARIFAPIGWRLDAPPVLLPAFLSLLERERGVRPPLLATPSAADPAVPKIIALGDGVALDEVDWRGLPETRP